MAADVALDAAPIKTKADLLTYLADRSSSNPINKLSEYARAHLIDTVIVNKNGEISSFAIEDIRSELTPADAYKVFALFGFPQLAGRVNNGRLKSQLDRDVTGLPAKKGGDTDTA